MLLALIFLGGLVLVLAGRIIRSERELRRIAHFLTQHNLTSNGRVSITTHTRGFNLLVQAINTQIDNFQNKQRATEQEKDDLRRGLTYLSHDIRTPLTGAQGYVQLLDKEHNQTLRAHYLATTTCRLQEVNNLLDQLYTYAQAQDPDYRIEREMLEVNEVVATTLTSLYPLFKEQGLKPHIKFEDKAYRALSNRDALERIFRNLILNALRYGYEAVCIEQSKNCFTFTNRIENPHTLDLHHLFDKFYRGSAARTDEGSGLGLAIVAQLAKRLDITLAAKLEGDLLSITLKMPE